MTSDQPQRTARAEFSAWVRQECQDVSTIVAPELAERAVRHFRAKDGFMTRWADEQFEPWAYDLVISIFSQARAASYEQNRECDEEEFKQRFAYLHRYRVHADGRHIKLLDAGRSDLLSDAEDREERANTDLRRAKFERKVAGRLKGDETVRLKWTEKELDQLYRRIVEREDDKQPKSAKPDTTTEEAAD